MRDPNDGSDPTACGAPWNEGDNGECCCTRCNRLRRLQAKEEARMDEDKENWDEETKFRLS